MLFNKLKYVCLSLMVMLSFTYSQTVDLSFGAADDQGAEVLISIPADDGYDIGGFQFDVTGVSLTAASGGLAADYGFTVSVGTSTVIGFSLTGSVIPAGASGVLTNITYTANNLEACLTDEVIADSDGGQLDSTVGDCTTIGEIVEGCTDSDACNYDEDANTDDGSCTYPEGPTCDCDGNIDEGYCDCDGNMNDCEGDCGGDAVEDECGECGGDGTSCTASISFGSWTGTSMEIMVNTGTTDLAGFQFATSGLTLTGATGGLAEDNGLTVSVGADSGIVIGFSLTGTSIPAGSTGVLTNLSVSGTTDNIACMFDGVFSDPDGVAIDYLLGDCISLCDSGDTDNDGICDDVDECPNDPNNDADDDGICDDVDDCVGDYDDCGVCNGGNADQDECGECFGDGTSCINFINFGVVSETDSTNTMEIYLSSVDDVAGFQFDVEGVTLNDVYGGVIDAGFTVSFNESGTIIGFSLTGDVIPAGETQLVMADFNVAGPEACLSFDNNGALSDSNGDSLPADTGDCVAFDTAVGGCTDMDACNYNENANYDDGSCVYPEGTCDCDGNPMDDYCDCDGNVEDECGECGGDGIGDGECDCDGNVEDCAGECGGDAVVDECDECDGDGPSYECPDGSLVCDASECSSSIDIGFGMVGDNYIEITYDSSHEIAGFQFTVSGVLLDDASGGAAEENGFTVSVNGDTGIVVGFTLSGDWIPVGSGVLTILSASNPDGNAEACLSDVVISDPDANPFDDVLVGECADLTMMSISDNMPTEYILSQNYPNPFNPITTIGFTIPAASDVSIKVYDLSGKVVNDLISGYFTPGTYNVQWNAIDNHGNEVSSGIYIYQLNTQEGIYSSRMILMR